MRTFFLRTVMLAVCTVLASIIAYAQDRGFHAAESEQEKALDLALARESSDENMIAFIVNFPQRDTKKDVLYADMFTSTILTAWADAEAKMVQEQCHGEYQDGELCGLGYNPFTCAQDSPDHYLYRTIGSNAQETIIAMKWSSPEPSSTGITYRLIKDQHKWKIDGVDCGNGQKFNVP